MKNDTNLQLCLRIKILAVMAIKATGFTFYAEPVSLEDEKNISSG